MRETFELALRDAKILINEEFDQGSDIYYFNLSGPTGKTVDSELFNEGDEGFDLIRDLFTAVRRNALHVDDLIDRVISEVENDRN